MAESTKVEHVKGLYLIIVALISLIGGYLLKSPIEKYVFKSHCQIGGTWKPHGDLLLHCDIHQDGKTFFIRIEGSTDKFEKWMLNGKGKTDGEKGEFDGTFSIGKEKDMPLKGKVNLQGCDGLGVTIFEGDNFKPFSFIRETSQNPENKTESESGK